MKKHVLTPVKLIGFDPVYSQ